MQHFILNGKVLQVEKNKENALAIPVLFNARSSEFTLEVPDEQFKPGLVIELSVYRASERKGSWKIPVEMPERIYRFKPQEITDMDPGDYLLHSCRSNRSVRLSLSIAALE